MSKKSFLIILVLSVVVTYAIALIGFGLNITKGNAGFPFVFSSFNFLGAETDNAMLTLDVLFWFIIILVVWKLLGKLFKKS